MPDNPSEVQISKFVALSWNIEGLKRNIFSLQHYISQFKPSLIFLSEPLIFSCDVSTVLKSTLPTYKFHLNSEDLFDSALPLERARAKGGTLVLWPSDLDPFITILPAPSASILPCKVCLPGLLTSYHICIYLPTAGLNDDFVSTLAALDVVLQDIYTKHDGQCPVFIRGDANSSSKNAFRAPLLEHFMQKHELQRVHIGHPTYHHFLGGGQFDSDLDVLLFTSVSGAAEEIDQIICKHDSPLIDSSHDLLISSFTLPPSQEVMKKQPSLTAPRVENKRIKVIWSEEGIAAYKTTVGLSLSTLREATAGVPMTPSSMSTLLSSTYNILSDAASSTNRTIKLGAARRPPPSKSPVITCLQRSLLSAHREVARLLGTGSSPESLLAAREALHKAKSSLKQATRAHHRASGLKRDASLNFILDRNPTSLFRSIKSSKAGESSAIQSIRVDDVTYSGNNVPDGFFDSMSRLKCPDMSSITHTPEFRSVQADYENIIQICKSGKPIPQITLEQSTEILLGVRAEVNDFFSITANHFIHLGPPGIAHFHFLLSALLKNFSLSSINELNSAWACILYKGHQKDRESDRSYRNISTCPFLSKCADIYVGKIYSGDWALSQAETQFQGEGSSHELAAVLFTETVQYSLFTGKNNVFALLLDAKSAFDNVVRQCAIRAAFLAGSRDQGLLYLDTRLSSRRTFPEWEKVLMGPIDDQLGLEQGGVNSDKMYKNCNNNQLDVAQKSELGIHVGAAVVSAIGQADDTVLLSDNLYKLAGLVYLAEEYCRSYHVTLVPEKTKLLAFTTSRSELDTKYFDIINPITIAGDKISFVENAEHVGIVRSTSAGNMPHILGRVSAHRKAIMSVLHCGLARGHQGNPIAGLRVERIYGAPVLLSGTAALVLKTSELSVLHSHYRKSVRQLLRMPINTPECFIMLMAGCLPATALVHLRILGLLGMIGRLGPNNILNRIGRHALLSVPNLQSWFIQARKISAKYGLPDPLLVLQHPPTKSKWKNLCRGKVTDHWEQKYRGEATLLPSLTCFKPNFYSLAFTHRTFSTAGSPYEVNRATIVARMLSGRYITDHRTRHWDRSNPAGHCRLCPHFNVGSAPPLGDLAHQLLHCAGLAEARTRAVQLWALQIAKKPHLRPLIAAIAAAHPDEILAFILDPSSVPGVIRAAQAQGKLVYKDCHHLSRVWCYGNHKMRMKYLKFFGYLK